MGADPVNNVDPDGGAIGGFLSPIIHALGGSLTSHVAPTVGQFSGTAQGTSLSTSSSAGSSGGGSASGMALNAAGNMIAGYLGQMVANKLFPLPSGPDAGQLQSCGGRGPSSGSSRGGQQSSRPSQPVPQSGGCNCPPGYAPTPKRPGDQPLFLDADDAAKDWAYKARPRGMHGTIEYSSLLVSTDVPSANGKFKTTLFGTTGFARFADNDQANDPHVRSPGPNSPLHGAMPGGFRLAGQLHTHWSGSETKDDLHNNRSFSPADQKIQSSLPQLYFYVLGATGDLHAKYPNSMPLVRDGNGNYDPDHREGESDKTPPGGKGFYKSGLTRPEACRCYKQ